MNENEIGQVVGGSGTVGTAEASKPRRLCKHKDCTNPGVNRWRGLCAEHHALDAGNGAAAKPRRRPAARRAATRRAATNLVSTFDARDFERRLALAETARQEAEARAARVDELQHRLDLMQRRQAWMLEGLGLGVPVEKLVPLVAA